MIGRFPRCLWTLFLAFAVPLGAVPCAHAQVAPTTFAELRLKAEPGDTIYVTEANTRERRAKILDLSRSSLLVTIDGRPRELTEAKVTRIRRRMPDPIWNGAAIGAGVYFGLGAIMVAALGEGECGGRCMGINAALAAGIGGSLGAGIDALIEGRKTIYELPGRGSSRHLAVRPLLSANLKGLSASVVW